MHKVALVASVVLFSLPLFAVAQTAAPAMSAPEVTAPATAAPVAAAAPATPARLPCETLKARLDAKLQAKGVPSYTLEIVPIEGANSGTDSASGVVSTQKSNAKQVGTCDGGTKRLMYTRGN